MSPWNCTAYIKRLRVFPFSCLVLLTLALFPEVGYSDKTSTQRLMDGQNSLSPPLEQPERIHIDGLSMACGPRAVEEIMKFYGLPCSFIDLFDEISPNEEGSSMLDLALCLENHGIKTLPVDLGENLQIRWPFPILVHLKDRKGGHFAVLRVSEINRVELSLGQGAFKNGSWKDLRGICSSSMLLTSDKEITTLNNVITRHFSWHVYLFFSCLLFGFAVMHFSLRKNPC